MLMHEMPWQIPVTHPPFVEATLSAASARGDESLAKVGRTLRSITVIYRAQTRTMGRAPERQVALRDEAQKLADGFAAGTPTRQFYESVVASAGARLRQAELEDEELSEPGLEP